MNINPIFRECNFLSPKAFGLASDVISGGKNQTVPMSQVLPSAFQANVIGNPNILASRLRATQRGVFSDIDNQITRRYKIGEYGHHVNGFLREGDEFLRQKWSWAKGDEYSRRVEDLKKFVSDLDTVFKKSSVPEDVKVYRAVPKEFFENIKSTDGVFDDKGFVSTSYSRAKAAQHGSDMLEIEVPKGSKAMDMEVACNLKNDCEEELLLPRNSRFEVQSIENIDGKRVMKARLLPQDV